MIADIPFISSQPVDISQIRVNDAVHLICVAPKEPQVG